MANRGQKKDRTKSNGKTNQPQSSFIHELLPRYEESEDIANGATRVGYMTASEWLEPARFLELPKEVSSKSRHQGQNKGIAKLVTQFWHVVKIHTVDSGNHGWT